MGPPLLVRTFKSVEKSAPKAHIGKCLIAREMAFKLVVMTIPSALCLNNTASYKAL